MNKDKQTPDTNTVEGLTEAVKQWSTDRGIYDPVNGGTMVSQFMKLLEEFGETVSAIKKNKTSEIADGIGDQKVCLINTKELSEFDLVKRIGVLSLKDKITLQQVIILGNMAQKMLNISTDPYFDMSDDFAKFDELLHNAAEINGLEFKNCLDAAYNDIKDRKGQMIGRVFVKESDLPTEVKENVDMWVGDKGIELIEEVVTYTDETEIDQTDYENKLIVGLANIPENGTVKGFYDLTTVEHLSAFELNHNLALLGFDMAEINPSFYEWCEEFPDSEINVGWLSNPDLGTDDEMGIYIYGDDISGYTGVYNYNHINLSDAESIYAITLYHNLLASNVYRDVFLKDKFFMEWLKDNPTNVLGVEWELDPKEIVINKYGEQGPKGAIFTKVTNK